ncbi:MAG: hypothetical protein KDC90_19520, partial [Ignavibacteriae bacterium]|nr:hypothetical protein [Ignavibacteriota bacterium]
MKQSELINSEIEHEKITTELIKQVETFEQCLTLISGKITFQTLNKITNDINSLSLENLLSILLTPISLQNLIQKNTNQNSGNPNQENTNLSRDINNQNKNGLPVIDISLTDQKNIQENKKLEETEGRINSLQVKSLNISYTNLKNNLIKYLKNQFKIVVKNLESQYQNTEKERDTELITYTEFYKFLNKLEQEKEVSKNVLKRMIEEKITLIEAMLILNKNQSIKLQEQMLDFLLSSENGNVEDKFSEDDFFENYDEYSEVNLEEPLESSSVDEDVEIKTSQIDTQSKPKLELNLGDTKSNETLAVKNPGYVIVPIVMLKALNNIKETNATFREKIRLHNSMLLEALQNFLDSYDEESQKINQKTLKEVALKLKNIAEKNTSNLPSSVLENLSLIAGTLEKLAFQDLQKQENNVECFYALDNLQKQLNLLVLQEIQIINYNLVRKMDLYFVNFATANPFLIKDIIDENVLIANERDLKEHL